MQLKTLSTLKTGLYVRFCRVFLALPIKPGQQQDQLLQKQTETSSSRLRVSVSCLGLKPKLFVLEGAQVQSISASPYWAHSSLFGTI